MPELRTLATLQWHKYQVRRCLSLHHCEVCDGQITLGQRYYDGGYTRRAHERCIVPQAVGEPPSDDAVARPAANEHGLSTRVDESS